MTKPINSGRTRCRRAKEFVREIATIRDRIATLRGQRSGTYKDFADAIGAEPDTVAKWVKGESLPSADYLIVIAREFGVSADWLLGLRGATEGDQAERSDVVALAHAQVIRDVRRLSDRFTEDSVRAEIGEADEFWEWLLQQATARVLAQASYSRARSDLLAISTLEQARLERIMASASSEDRFPKTWQVRAPRLRPEQVEATIKAIQPSNPVAPRKNNRTKAKVQTNGAGRSKRAQLQEQAKKKVAAKSGARDPRRSRRPRVLAP